MLQQVHFPVVMYLVRGALRDFVSVGEWRGAPAPMKAAALSFGTDTEISTYIYIYIYSVI